MDEQQEGRAAGGVATAVRPEQVGATRIPLPEKDGWERMDGRLSGGYYRRAGLRAPRAAV
jgi:hypothetical protein